MTRKGEFPGMLKERTFRVVWISKEQAQGHLNRMGKTDQVIKYKGKTITVRMK
jgi:hypothetical protein